VRGKVLAEFFETRHLKRQMCQIRLDFHQAAAGEKCDFDLLRAAGRFEKDQFRAAR
jgi:hypothetical protein